MTESILDYDSSDSELPTHSTAPPSIRHDDNFLYNAGNAILHHQKVFKEYRDKKSFFKTKPTSKVVNKFLTHKVYLEDDKTDKALTPFLTISKANPELEKLFQDSRKLYKKVEETAKLFQKKDGIINTTNYIKVLYEIQDSDIETTFCIENSKVQEFKKKVEELPGFKANIDSLKLLTDRLPPMKQIIQKAISQQIEPDYPSLVVIRNLCEQFKDDVSYLTKAKELYTYLENLANSALYHDAGGVINTVNLKCFDVLQKANQGTEQAKAAADMWGIKLGEVTKFYQECTKHSAYQELIACQKKFQDGTNIARGKIQKFITKPNQAINFDLVLQLACDKEIENIAHRLSQGDQKISNKIKELDFFSTSEDLQPDAGIQPDAGKFLSNSLLYQKYLKTLAKFVSLRNLQGKEKHTIASKIISHENHELDIMSEFSSTSKRTEKVLTLGNYDNVSAKLNTALNRLKKSAQEVADLFQTILKGGTLYSEKNTNYTDYVKDLYDIAYLLFSCEPNRNPEALISNAMFLELVTRGKYQITEMSTKLPMAMASELNKQGGIGIGRYYHEQYEKQGGNRARKNDYGESKLQGISPEVQEFQKREQNLLQDFLELDKPVKPVLAVNQIKELLQDYVNKNTHLEFRKKGTDKDGKTLKEKIEGFTPDEMKEYVKNLTMNSGTTQDVLKTAHDNVQQIINDYSQELIAYKSELNKINATTLTKINQLIKDWYGLDVKLEAAGEKKDQVDTDINSKMLIELEPNTSSKPDKASNIFSGNKLEAQNSISYILKSIYMEDIANGKILTSTEGTADMKQRSESKSSFQKLTDYDARDSQEFFKSKREEYTFEIRKKKTEEILNHNRLLKIQIHNANGNHSPFDATSDEYNKSEQQKTLTSKKKVLRKIRDIGTKVKYEETINEMYCLSEEDMKEEIGIEIHSKLVENTLLNVQSSGIHVLFKEPADNYQHAENYLEENKYCNHQFYKFDYDNLQHIEVAGDVTSFH